MEELTLQDGLFCIEIKYERGSPSPERIFRATAEMIESLRALDDVLTVTLHPDVETVLTLEDTERGSLRTWLGTKLKNMPEDAVKNGEIKKFVGHYLNLARLKTLSWCEKHQSQQTAEDVVVLQGELVEIAKDAQLAQIPAYQAPNAARLLSSVERIARSLERLTEKDTVDFKSAEGVQRITGSFHLDPNLVESMVVHETIESRSKMLLKVKRPDFLGEAKWEFKHGADFMSAKIEDHDWLARNHARDPAAQVVAGDALRAEIVSKASYDVGGNVVEISHRIVKVLAVVPPETDTQRRLIE
jgi:hypothetical protein